MRDDEQQFRVFVTSTSSKLLGLALVMCGDRSRAEDLVQTAYEKVYARWGKLDDPVSYARQVVVNGSRDGWRHRRRHPERQGLDGVPDVPMADTAEGFADRDQLVRLLATLPRGQRAAVLLRHWFGLTEAEAATLLGVSVGTVKSQTSRGLRGLKAGLASEAFASLHDQDGDHLSATRSTT